MRLGYRCAWMAVAVLALVALSVNPAGAAMALTAAGTSQGFGLSTFASNFPVNGCCGPIGVTFPASGGVLVSDYNGSTYRFPTDTDNQTASSVTPVTGFGGNNGTGLADLNGLVYMAEQAAGHVVQLNDNGTLASTVTTGTPGATGIVGDPANGMLYVSNPFGAGIFRVDPTTGVVTTFSTHATDGLTLDNATQVLYGETNGHILGYNISNGTQVFDSGFVPGGADGAAIGQGSIAGELFVNTNSGQIVEVNVATSAQTILATGGSRGDLVAIDPNGSLLLTQTNSIIRLTPPSSGSFGTTTPEPATLGLMLGGLAGLFGWARRRKAVRG